MDPYAMLGIKPGASKADIKKAFFQKAKQHHPDMHTMSSESVQKAHDAAFRALNEAYQALMDGTYRPRQRAGAGRGSHGRAGAYYGAAAGAQYSAHYDPFASSYGENVGRGHWGFRNFGRRAGLDFRGAFRAFTSISRAEVAATAALGLLLAGGATLLEGTSHSLWARHNEGKLFDSIQQDVERRKRQQEQAAAEAAAAKAALRAATAAMRQRAAAAEAAEATAQREAAAAAAGPAVLATVLPATTSSSSSSSSSDTGTSIGGSSSGDCPAAGEAQEAAGQSPARVPAGLQAPVAARALEAGSSNGSSSGADAAAAPLPPEGACLDASSNAPAL